MHSESVSEPYVKTARTPEAVLRLRHELKILRRISHPGIVEVRGYRGGPRAAEILFTRVPGHTFAETRFDTRRLAMTMTALSMTVAHIHEQGVSHGAIRGDHVLISSRDGRPVLCGFGNAHDVTIEPDQRVADVRALGLLLNSKLRTSSDQLRARLAHERRKRPALPTPSQELERRLRAIVALTTTADDLRVPTARVLAGQLRAAIQMSEVKQKPRSPQNPKTARMADLRTRAGVVISKAISTSKDLVARASALGPSRRKTEVTPIAPSARPGRLAVPNASHRPQHKRSTFEVIKDHLPQPSMVLLAKCAATLAAVLLIFTVIWNMTENKAPEADQTAPVCPSQPPAPLVFDVDGDGCGDAVTLGDGSVTINADQFTVGRPGDLLALGRWNCDDRRTLALLRPTNGEVFVFDEWPDVGKDARPRLVGTVPDAAAIAADSDGACDKVSVTGVKGTRTFDGRAAAATTTSSQPNSSSTKAP